MSHPALNAAVRLWLKSKRLPIKKAKSGKTWNVGAIVAYEYAPDRIKLVKIVSPVGHAKAMTRGYSPEEMTKRLMIAAASNMQLKPNPVKKTRKVRKPKKGSTPRQYINRPSQTTKKKPTKRLRKRREKNIAQGRTGSYPNPKRRSKGYGKEAVFV